MSVLDGAHVVLWVTGSVAAYKASDLASKLTQAGANVDVILSKAAEAFVGALTFEALTHRAVLHADDAMTADHRIAHVEIAKDADIVVVAPATANTIALLAHGQADDLGAAVVLTTDAPVMIAPAMESDMYAHSATQANLKVLRERKVRIVEPATGRLASGAYGQGRLPTTPELMDVIREVLGRDGPLNGCVLVVSAGGTPPINAETTHVSSASEMLDALRQATCGCDALIMNAAVGDYRPVATSKSKLKRDDMNTRIEVVENPDLLASLQGDFIRVGFAAETDNHLANAREKLRVKGLDALVVNDVAQSDRGFGVATNAVTILRPNRCDQEVKLTDKAAVADAVLDVVVELVGKA